jgi:hypothetical protein
MTYEEYRETRGMVDRPAGGSTTGGYELSEITSAVTGIKNIINRHIGVPVWNDGNKSLTFTAENGANLVVSFPLEALSYGLDYDKTKKEIILSKSDGTEIRVSVADLVDVLEGSIGNNIQITVENGVIHAKLLAGAITEDHLDAALKAIIDGKADIKYTEGEITRLDKALDSVVNEIRQTAGNVQTGRGTSIFAITEDVPNILGEWITGDIVINVGNSKINVPQYPSGLVLEPGAFGRVEKGHVSSISYVGNIAANMRGNRIHMLTAGIPGGPMDGDVYQPGDLLVNVSSGNITVPKYPGMLTMGPRQIAPVGSVMYGADNVIGSLSP